MDKTARFRVVTSSRVYDDGTNSHSLVFILRGTTYETFIVLASHRLACLRESGCESKRASVRTWYCFVCMYRVEPFNELITSFDTHTTDTTNRRCLASPEKIEAFNFFGEWCTYFRYMKVVRKRGRCPRFRRLVSVKFFWNRADLQSRRSLRLR